MRRAERTGGKGQKEVSKTTLIYRNKAKTKSGQNQ